jgi:hypothetical protein
MKQQLGLFDGVLAAYAGGNALSNAQLYTKLGDDLGLDEKLWSEKTAIGKSGQLHSPLKRQVRWYQQTLKSLGLLEKDGGVRGQWRLTEKGAKKLTPAEDSKVLLGFSTHLGLALWSKAESAMPSLGQPVHLVLSSFP